MGAWGFHPPTPPCPPPPKWSFLALLRYIWVKCIKLRVYSSMDHSRQMHTFQDIDRIDLSKKRSQAETIGMIK